MNKLLQNPIFQALSGLRLASILLIIFAIATGTATYIESYYSGIGSTDTGRAAAYDLVYDALWFNALLILFCVNMALNLVRRLAKGSQPVGYLLVHVGILVILVGAGMTRWMGYEGYLRIREGEANNVVASADAHIVVQGGGDMAQYPVRLYRPGPQGKQQRVTLGDSRLTLGVAEYWPRFERSLEPGEGGFAQVSLGAMSEDGLQMHTMRAGDQETMGGVVVRFHRDGLPALAEGEAQYGTLRVRADGAICTLPVTPEPGLLGNCGDWRFELTEFAADYHTEGHGDPDGPLANPMIKVLVASPDGESAERTLFALHPEFALDTETAPLLEKVDMLYELPAGVDLAVEDGAVVMRAAFPLTVNPMMSEGEERTYEPGAVVPVEKQMLYQGGEAFKIVPSEVAASLVSVPRLSDNPNTPAAARVYVEQDGERAEAVCIKGGAPQRVELGGRTLRLSYGAVMSRLPYSLYLEDFLLETYPGSDNPASYESHVVLSDPDKGVEGRRVRIWMNHPLNHRGTKHFQSSYDQDRLGTVLSVNRDPGKVPTYIGYTIISLGFCLVIFNVIRDRVRAYRTTAPAAALVAALAALAVLAPTGARAQHGGAAPPPIIDLSPAAHDQAASLIVQDFRGRMKPLDTLARETAVKITKKTRFEGRDPIEVFFGFVVHPSQWYHYPCIAVKNNGVKDLLGVSRDTHHVSLASVLEGGRYKLQDQVEAAHRTPANQRDKTQQKLILFDERVHILYSALQGTSLRIYPIPDDPKHTWQSIEVVLQGLGDNDPRRLGYQQAADALLGGLSQNDDAMIRAGLQKTGNLQHQFGGQVMPSEFRVDSELRLNTQHPFARSTLPYMGGFVVLIIAYFWSLFRRDGRPWRWRNPFYALGMLLFVAGFAMHLYGFVLRWIASGRAPLSNGHESLLWVALAVALAGLIFEVISRTGAVGALGSLLTAVVLGVSMMAAFDPAIGPLVPVLASYWLNIHVTIITASYGFLGLCCLLGFLTLVLILLDRFGKGNGKSTVASAIGKLDRLNVDVMIAGLGLLTVGTLLGGVWANESWGRYWGWDPKETWALVSVLVYAVILHFRWIPGLANPFVQATGSFLAIWAIIHTYFGVNYLLVGLHSYAAGDAVTVPTWIVATFLGMVALSVITYFGWRDGQVGRKRGEGLAP